MAGQPGLEAVLDCREQVTVDIRNHLDHVANYLRKKGIIDLQLYTAATNSHSAETGAKEVYRRLQDMVQADEKYYGIFMEYLRSNPEKFEKTIGMLDKAYVDNGGSLPSAPPLAIPALDSKQIPKASPPQDEAFVLEVPEILPERFSESFNAMQFAQWMKGRRYLEDKDCKKIIDFNITGFVFAEMDEEALWKVYQFEKSGFYTLRRVMKMIPKETSGFKVDPQPILKLPQQDKGSEHSDGYKRARLVCYPAVDRGTYKPKLKLEPGDRVEMLNLKETVSIPGCLADYYPMTAKKHGVCLIINNKFFNDPALPVRTGTDRDEYNLIETWRYLGYHIEVRRQVEYQDIMEMLYDIDDMLLGINTKYNMSQVENDSFVCCILSHGSNSSIYSCDSKKVRIVDMESAVGTSEILQGKPKLFFIESSQLNCKTIFIEEDHRFPKQLPDFYISYSTSAGEFSYRHTLKGSIYISVICRILCEISKQSTLNELQMYTNKAILDESYAIQKIIGIFKQMPSCTNKLCGRVHFFFEHTP